MHKHGYGWFVYGAPVQDRLFPARLSLLQVDVFCSTWQSFPRGNDLDALGMNCTRPPALVPLIGPWPSLLQ